MMQSSSFRTRALLIGVTVLWLGGVCYGIDRMSRYVVTRAEQQPLLQVWPLTSSLVRSPGRMTLVMFVHPLCPCTRASLIELEELIDASSRHIPNTVDAFVVFLSPSGAPAEWTESKLLDRVRARRGVTVVNDRDGAEGRLFHADISGVVALYDNRGRLMFSGGITAGRGETGENGGLRQVRALLSGEMSAAQDAPVFGCPLTEPAAQNEGAP
jgi:hypothetical protein